MYVVVLSNIFLVLVVVIDLHGGQSLPFGVSCRDVSDGIWNSHFCLSRDMRHSRYILKTSLVAA